MTTKAFTSALILSAVLAIGLASCKDTAGGKPGAAASSELAQAPAAISNDSIPIRSPEGKLTRYGLESGRITYKYSGTATGERTTTFDQWGLRERTEDSVSSKSPNPQLNRSIISISTPDRFLKMNRKDLTYVNQPNQLVAGFDKMDSTKSKSFGMEMLKANFPEKLPDTVIKGYKCQVYRRSFDSVGSSITVYFWRGISIHEHIVMKNDSTDFTVDAVDIKANIGPLSQADLSPPAGYKETQPQMPQGMGGAPPQGGGGAPGGQPRGGNMPPQGQGNGAPGGQPGPGGQSGAPQSK